MDYPRRIWTNFARFFEALDGIDDPMGEYMSSLGNRVDKLEHEVNLLQEATHPRDAGRTISE